MFSAALNSRTIIWAVIYSALLVQTYRFFIGASFYGEYLHWTGEQSTRLLIIAIAATPLRRLFPAASWVRWLLRRRRDIGVASFFYAAAHTVAYLIKKGSIESIVSGSLAFEIAVGWAAFVVLLLLAATSNNYSVRVMGRKWKLLHKAVFLGAAFTLLHWIMTAFDPAAGYLHLGIVLVLIALRMGLSGRKAALG